MNIKQTLSQNRLVFFIRLLLEYFYEIFLFSKELGTSDKSKKHSKFKADLTIRFHAIEKGLSIGKTKIGFGQKKILSALNDLFVFYNKFKDTDFVLWNLKIIDEYIKFNKENDFVVPEIGRLRDKLYDNIGNEHDFGKMEVGAILKKEEGILKSIHFDFPQFVTSRYSIRDFNPEMGVNEQDIYEALEIAKKTPSACNRQPWHVHLFSSELKNKLLDFQGGCKGFGNDIEYAVLLTCDLNGYFIHEINQAYVDGGLYGMNFLYALHYKGLATIPLTTAFKQKKQILLKQKFDIPLNEVPIMIIGIGTYKDEYKVAASHRISYNDYLKEH